MQMKKVMNKGIAKAKKEQKRIEAEERQELYNGLTPTEKIGKLDRTLGKDIGAKKERARLKKLTDGGA